MIPTAGIYIEKRRFSNAIDIVVFDTQTNSVAKPLVFEKNDEAAVPQPCMTITQINAQKLMDELWDAGLRPSEGSGSAGAMAATQKHLEDMRKLVFEKPSSL